jgi:dihydrofolate reductase
MRGVTYRVASSLDGYIAGPKGEMDWIVHDPAIDFASLYKGTDTVLLGRRTYELTQRPGAPAWPTGWRIYVFSRTLRTVASPATLVDSNVGEVVNGLRAEHGENIWLFGGGGLFATLLTLNAVDRLVLTIVPVLLGGGIPFLASGASATRLKLTHSEAYPSGIIQVTYDIHRSDA